MAVVDKNVYSLNIYDGTVSNAMYNCKKSEEACKKMLSKLIFYDREELVDMHIECMDQNKGNYDLSKIKPVNILDKGERFYRVFPLDKNWLGIVFSDKDGNVIPNKAMYISPDGDGFVTDEMEPLKNGCVAESVYIEYRRVVPYGLFKLDEKYYDGSHDDLLFSLWQIVRKSATDILFEITNDKSITIDTVDDYIIQGFRNSKTKEERLIFENVDLAMSLFDLDGLLKFEKYYFSKYPEKQ